MLYIEVGVEKEEQWIVYTGRRATCRGAGRPSEISMSKGYNF